MTDQDAAVRLGHHKQPEQQSQYAGEVKTDVETIAGQGKLPKAEVEHTEAELIRQQVRRPAIGLLATGIINWIGTGVVMFTLGYLELIPGYALLITGPGMLILSGFIFFAALKMMRLEAYRWALVAAIMAMIVSPGNIIGLPFGIWALVVLTSSQVKAAFAGKNKVAESKTSESEAETPKRRFSRAAIVGACCMPLALFAHRTRLFGGHEGPVGMSPTHLVLFFLGWAGLAAPFVTTILGIVSITHIRHSAGRLYGMGLALFDALLFPLLALDVVLYFLVFISARELVRLRDTYILEPGLILISLLVCPIVDILIIRWAWRKANAGLERPQGDQIAGTP